MTTFPNISDDQNVITLKIINFYVRTYVRVLFLHNFGILVVDGWTSELTIQYVGHLHNNNIKRTVPYGTVRFNVDHFTV